MRKKEKLFLLMLLFIAPMFIACDKEENEKEIPVVYKPEMLSFAFMEKDNSGIILKDYIVDAIDGTSIKIFMPEEIDKSSLIASFTTSTETKVEVGGKEQVSGVTTNDFSSPVDYIVTQGTENKKYTVTVEDAPSSVWSAIPSFSADDVKSVLMKVNSKDDNPYFLYKQKRESSDDEGAEVVVFKNGQWESLGQASDGRIGIYFNMTFDNNGVPYVAYTDYTTGANNFLTVKKKDGSSWSSVGDNGFTSAAFTYHSLAFTPENKLLLAGTFDGRTGPLARRELSVNFFENGAWSIDNTVPGRESSLVAYLVKTVRKGNSVYVGIYNAVSPNTISVYKYTNGEWETLIDKWTDVEATSISLRAFAFDVDNDGNIYAAISDNSSEGTEKHRVIKYDSSTKEIESVGNHIVAAVGSYVNFDIAVSPFGIPFLVYRNESQFPTVINFDTKSQDWTEPKILDANIANEVSIDFASDGTGYLSYLKDNIIYAYKYSSPA